MDKTEIILNSALKLVKYRSKKGERSEYPLDTVQSDSDLEVVKRLKYTKEMLSTILQDNQKESKTESSKNEHQNNFAQSLGLGKNSENIV